MKKTNDELDQELYKLYKSLSPEKKEMAVIILKWMPTASKAETKEFDKLLASKDRKAVETFVESIKTGGVSI